MWLLSILILPISIMHINANDFFDYFEISHNCKYSRMPKITAITHFSPKRNKLIMLTSFNGIQQFVR